ncbi:MAG: hypothetical protein M0027_02740 [Candidatus Dormibacteraeota bacterium]|nr:hypothetical protein [Candidatus Dormibacteraeota bacterium]
MKPTAPRLWAAGIAGAGVACALLVATITLGAVDEAAGLLLLLVLPAAAVVNALDSGRGHFGLWELVFWGAAADVGALVLGGLALNWLGGLTSLHWAMLAAVLPIGAGGVAWWRGYDADVVNPRIARTAWVRAPRGATLWVVAALAAAGALGLSVYSSQNFHPERFAQVWLLPVPFNAGSYAVQARIGVTNEEARRAAFVVSVTIGNQVILAHHTIVLAPGSTWSREVSRAVHQPVHATLALAGSPSHIIGQVYLAVPVP